MLEPSDRVKAVVFGHAKWAFAQHASHYFHQAHGEAKLAEYFHLINIIYQDRWPRDIRDDSLIMDKVCFQTIPATLQIQPKNVVQSQGGRSGQYCVCDTT
jgi:hypothetical protein